MFTTSTITAATATIGQTPTTAITFTVGTWPFWPDDPHGLAGVREPRSPLPDGPPPAMAREPNVHPV